MVPQPTYTSLKFEPVSILKTDYCKDKLENNLKVEQPKTKRRDFEDLNEGKGVICIGRNYSRNFHSDMFFEKAGENIRKIEKPSKEIIQSLKNQGIQEYDINGGPSCFGDSGGPLFSIDQKKGIANLIGVFSFLLWGTCQGAAEPAYYAKLSHHADWLKFYLENDVDCWSSQGAY